MSSVFGNPPAPTQPGPCIFGQGYCSPITNNVLQSINESLTSNIQSQLSQVSSSMGATTSQQQIIDFSGSDFTLCQDFNISDISQKMTAQVNMSMLTSQMTQQKLDQLVGNAVTATQKTGTSSSNGFFSGGNNASTLNLQQTYNKNTTLLSQSVTLQQFNTMVAEITQLQKINFSGIKVAGKMCNINNLSQDMALTLLASMMSDQVSTTLANLVSKNSLSDLQKADTSNVSTGPLQDIANVFSSMSSTMIIAIIGVIIFLVVIAMILRRGGGGETTEEIVTTTGAPPTGAGLPFRNQIAELTM